MTTSTTQGLITDTEKPVQGTALYAEFQHRTGSAVTQVFFTPDGTDEDGRTVYAKMFMRTLTTERPKRQWATTSLRNSLTDENGVSDEAYRFERVAHFEQTFRRLHLRGYELVKNPFVVEVSRKDLADIRNGKTPTKVIYRIGQTRTALDFPTTLVK